MKKVYFATGNKGKYKTLKESLKQYDIILVHKSMDFKELDSDDLGAIACDKVVKAYKDVKEPVFSLDAGFYIHSLDGFPGANVNPALEDGVKGILKMLENKSRICKFRQCLAYLESEMLVPKTFYSTTSGKLSEEPRGSIKGKPYWSKLWLVFIPEGESKTLAEMTNEEYTSWRFKRKNHSIGTKFGEWYSKR